eukprot:3492569-Rhodomonas_salina.1
MPPKMAATSIKIFSVASTEIPASNAKNVLNASKNGSTASKNRSITSKNCNIASEKGITVSINRGRPAPTARLRAPPLLEPWRW